MAVAVVVRAGGDRNRQRFGYRALLAPRSLFRSAAGDQSRHRAEQDLPAAASKETNKLITDQEPDHGQDAKLVSREEEAGRGCRSDPAGAPPAQARRPTGGQAAPGNGAIRRRAEEGPHHCHPPRSDRYGRASWTRRRKQRPAPVVRAGAEEPVSSAVTTPEPPSAPNHPPFKTPAPARHPVGPRGAGATAACGAAGVALANAPLSLSPNAPAGAARPRRAPRRPCTRPRVRREPQAARSGSYAVQISSRRSEAEAQAAFRGLQAKYPESARQPADARSTKSNSAPRAPFTAPWSAPSPMPAEASQLCSGLKAAGGQCLIQRN